MRTKVGLLGSLLVIGLLFAGCGGGSTSSSRRSVELVVYGAGGRPAWVTSVVGSDYKDYRNVNTPWRKTVVAHPGQEVAIEASTKDYETMICEILVDGVPLDTAVALSKGELVTCAGVVK